MKKVKCILCFVLFSLFITAPSLLAQKPKKGGFQRTVISISDLKKADIPKTDSSQDENTAPSSVRGNHKAAESIGDFNKVYTSGAMKQGNNYPKGRMNTIDSAYVENLQYSISIVQQGKLFGAVSDVGKVVLPIIYDDVAFYNRKDSACSRWEGVLRIKKDGLYALCRPDGSPMTALSFEEIPYLPETCGGSQAVFKVKQGGKFGLIDSKGGILIRPVYDDVFMLKNERGKLTVPEVACVRKQNKFGFLELREKQILPTNFDKIAFLQQLEIAEKDKITTNLLVKVWLNGKCGVMNLTKKTEIPVEFSDIQPFENELAVVQKDNKFGFISLAGKEKIAIKYDFAYAFHNGVAIVKKGESFGAINLDKKEIIGFDYQSLEYLIEKPKKGNDAQEFFAQFLKAKKGNKYGIINQQGKLIIPFAYSELTLDTKGFGFKAKKDKDLAEEFVIMPTMSSIK
jgi:hypothetical protein